jgi:hypothetical protein
MTTYRDIKVGRGLVWAGILLGYVVAIGVTVSNLTTEYGTVLTALAFLMVLSIPSTMALLALDRRPSLQTAATMSAILIGVLLLFAVIGLAYVVMAILWYQAGQRRPRPPIAPVWASWARPLLAAATILPLIVTMIHLDPRCTITDADGNVTISSDTEFPAGWGWSYGASVTTTSDDRESASCTTDTTQPWEALLSMGVSASVVVLASRWPTASNLDRNNRPQHQAV